MSMSSPPGSVRLLYPFYLDGDMSMAFAAALTGGVSLEQEQVDRTTGSSQSLRSLQGNIRLWKAGGAGVERQTTEGSDAMNESRLIRRHTEASIFIDLYDELLRGGHLAEEPAFEELKVGDLVSIRLGPAVAPLLRVVEQLIRLMDLMLPMLDPEGELHDAGTRQQRRAAARDAAKQHVRHEPDDELSSLRQIRNLFIALREDLNHSGLVDVGVDADPTARSTRPNRISSDESPVQVATDPGTATMWPL